MHLGLGKEGDFGKEPVKVKAGGSLTLGRAATEDVVRQAGVSGGTQTEGRLFEQRNKCDT